MNWYKRRGTKLLCLLAWCVVPLAARPAAAQESEAALDSGVATDASASEPPVSLRGYVRLRNVASGRCFR